MHTYMHTYIHAYIHVHIHIDTQMHIAVYGLDNNIAYIWKPPGLTCSTRSFSFSCSVPASMTKKCNCHVCAYWTTLYRICQRSCIIPHFHGLETPIFWEAEGTRLSWRVSRRQIRGKPERQFQKWPGILSLSQNGYRSLWQSLYVSVCLCLCRTYRSWSFCCRSWASRLENCENKAATEAVNRSVFLVLRGSHRSCIPPLNLRNISLLKDSQCKT